MTSQEDRLDKLWEHRVFRDLNWAQMEKIQDFVDLYPVRERKSLTKEGKVSDRMYFLLEGRCKVLRTNEKTEQPSRIATVRAGRMLGELSLFDAFPSSASVVTEQQCMVAELSRDSLEQLGQKHPRIARDLLWGMGASLARKLRKTTSDLAKNSE